MTINSLEHAKAAHKAITELLATLRIACEDDCQRYRERFPAVDELAVQELILARWKLLNQEIGYLKRASEAITDYLVRAETAAAMKPLVLQ